MADLIVPHGGLTEPVCCTVAEADRESFLAEAGGLTSVPVSAADLSSVYRFADGTLSPLTGPMTSAQWNQVLQDSTVDSAGSKYAWTIPIALPVTSELAARLSSGQKVALTCPEGNIVGTVDIEDVFKWDKPTYLESVYGTDRTDHPGADMALVNDAELTHLIGGEIKAQK